MIGASRGSVQPETWLFIPATGVEFGACKAKPGAQLAIEEGLPQLGGICRCWGVFQQRSLPGAAADPDPVGLQAQDERMGKEVFCPGRQDQQVDREIWIQFTEQYCKPQSRNATGDQD